MNKTLVIAASVIAGLALPFLGMTISPTRDIILGLAPDQAVLSLADQIDAQRVSVDQAKIESDAKLAEFQSTIDAQQAKLAEQQKLIDSQITSIKAESKVVQASVNNESTCRKLYLDNPDCNKATYRNKTDFNKFVDNRKDLYEDSIDLCKESNDRRKSAGEDARSCDSKDSTDYDALDSKFEKCQEIIAKCG
jgi:hypothetical protein